MLNALKKPCSARIFCRLLKGLIIFLLIIMQIRGVFVYASQKHLKEADTRLEYINLPFWQKFNDDILIHYIVCAISNNYGLKALRTRINEVRAAKNIEVSKQFPSFSVGANYLGLKIPRVAIPFQGFRDNAFALPFITHWEIDLFAKRKNKIEKNRTDYHRPFTDCHSNSAVSALLDVHLFLKKQQGNLWR